MFLPDREHFRGKHSLTLTFDLYIPVAIIFVNINGLNGRVWTDAQ